MENSEQKTVCTEDDYHYEMVRNNTRPLDCTTDMQQELKNSGLRKKRQIATEPILDTDGNLILPESPDILSDDTNETKPETIIQTCPDELESTCVTNCDAVTCHDYLRLNKTAGSGGAGCISTYMCEMQCKCKDEKYFHEGECISKEKCHIYGEMLANDHHEVKQPCSSKEKQCNGGMVWFECHNNCPIRTCADAALDVYPHCYMIEREI